MTGLQPIVHRRSGEAGAALTQLRPHANGKLPAEPSAANRGLLRIGEAAAWLGLGRTKTYELVARGELPSVCIGRSRRVPLSALEGFVERLALENGL